MIFPKKFVVLDGHALIYRGYYALPPLHTQKGELVNAVYGFTTILLTILEKMRPDYLAVAFDLMGPTFRDALYADYKATRAETPDDLIPQVPRIKQVVEAFKIPVFEKEGFEADDLIATLATHVSNHAGSSNLELLVVTGDMDLTQLITDRVKIVAPLSGFNEMKVYDSQAVMDKYGIWPQQMVDFKALVGDVSDNLPGVPGIGKKTGAKLLFQYESLEGVYAHIDEITGAVHDKLLAGKESAYQCQKLVQLVKDVPLTLDLEACKTHVVDTAKIKLLFEELEFKRLIPKFNGLQDHWSTIDQPAMF